LPWIHEKYAVLAQGGIAGVMIFFALSGYLITTRFAERIRECRPIDLRNFYLRRAFRILPSAITFLSVVWILSRLASSNVNGRFILSALFFYSNYVNLREMAWRVGHFWSLSVEEQFLSDMAMPADRVWRDAGLADCSVLRHRHLLVAHWGHSLSNRGESLQ